MAKRLITFGCSHTKDNYQKTWPDYLCQLMGLELSNQGARGAGMDFVSKRVIGHEIHSDDLVFIMLPSRDRFDWYIDSDSFMQQQGLEIASWQDGQQPDLVQVDGTLSKEHGFVLSGGEHRGTKKYWFKYFYSEQKASLDFWHFVYQTQCHLKSLGAEYYFTSAHDLERGIEQDINLAAVKRKEPTVIDHIDFEKFICWKNDRGFLDFCRDHDHEIVRNHPVTYAHAQFSEFLYQQFQNLKHEEGK
jgi:hypothetical protein